MLKLSIQADWAADVTPVRMAVDEALSRCHRLTLDLISHSPNLSFTEVLRQPASVTAEVDGRSRIFGGVVTGASFGGTLPAERYWYRLVIEPRLRLLDLTRRSRVFCTDPPATVAELLRQVIATAEGVSIPATDVTLLLRETAYPVLDLAVQYDETDLAFFCRRAEAAGIFFWLDTAADGSVCIMLGDSNLCFPLLGGSEEASRLPYRPRGSVSDDSGAIRSLDAGAAVVAEVATVNARDWTDPMRLLLARDEPGAGALGRVEGDDEPFSDLAWGEALARIRREEAAQGRASMRGHSDCLALRPGQVFTLTGHDRRELNTRHVVIAVHHQLCESVSGVEFLPHVGPSDRGYGNDFTAQPLSVPFRPARTTPTPRITGILPARVDGAGSARSDVDSLGGYRIVLGFDRQVRPPGKSSSRVRLLTPYGGASEGFHFPLRPGTQVMVAFVGGDPDRPVIVAPLYDAQQRSVVTSQNRHANVIRTVSGITMKFDDGPAPPPPLAGT